MELISIFGSIVLGLVIGSFLNVLIYRLPRGLGFAKGRSFCPKCRHKISWFDNIPLLSFVFLGGKCRYCKKAISWQYPVVELVTALLTILIINFKFQIMPPIGGTPPAAVVNQGQILNFKNYLDVICGLLLVWGLVVIFVIDLQHQIIPDEVIIFLTVLFLVFHLIIDNWSLIILAKDFLLPAIGSFLFLFAIYLITKGKGMGFGDVKLAGLMGLVLGFPKVIVAFYLAFLTGAFLGIILILTKQKKFGQHIAFGPFLAVSTFIAYLWGEKIIVICQKIFF